MFLTSVGAAYAHPDFALVETEARAGDTVHFSITGANGPVTFELEIGHHDVVEDAVGAGKVVLGEFVLPHLGDSPKTVTVEAEMRDSRHKKTVKRKLRYLGPALPAARPPPPAPAPQPVARAPAPAPAPAAPPAAPDPDPVARPPSSAPAAPAPAEPAHAQQRTATPVSRTRKVRRRARRGRKQTKTPRKVQARRYTTNSAGVSRGKSPRRKARAQRSRARTAPLFDGVPERGPGNGAAGKGSAYASLNAITPAAAVLVPRADLPAGDHGGIGAAVIVPGLMGVAALALAGTALQRRRRPR